jgi:hypothetical protein
MTTTLHLRQTTSLETLVERVFLLTDWRWHEVTPGTFRLHGNTATWSYFGVPHLAPVRHIGSLGLPWQHE